MTHGDLWGGLLARLQRERAEQTRVSVWMLPTALAAELGLTLSCVASWPLVRRRIGVRAVEVDASPIAAWLGRGRWFRVSELTEEERAAVETAGTAFDLPWWTKKRGPGVPYVCEHDLERVRHGRVGQQMKSEDQEVKAHG